MSTKMDWSKVDSASRAGLRFLAKLFGDSAKAACVTGAALFVAGLDVMERASMNWQAGHVLKAIPETLAVLPLLVLSAAALKVALDISDHKEWKKKFPGSTFTY